VTRENADLDGTPAGATAFTSKRPGRDFPEIHRLSDMPPDLIVWFEKPANAVFAGEHAARRQQA
jgi:hypothetical protein